MIEKDDPIVSRNVLEMITVAHEYCTFIEKASDYKTEDILDYLQKICPLIYLKGSLLPEVEVEFPEANERFVVEEDWEKIFTTLREKFQSIDEYWFHDYNSVDMNDPIKGSLADNFADIYQDLKDFTLLYQKSSHAAKENAVHEIKALFTTHWGFLIVSAHRYIHYIQMAKQNKANDTE